MMGVKNNLVAQYIFIKREFEYEMNLLKTESMPYLPRSVHWACSDRDKQNHILCVKNHCEYLAATISYIEEFAFNCEPGVKRALEEHYFNGISWCIANDLQIHPDSYRKYVERFLKMHMQITDITRPDKEMLERFEQKHKELQLDRHSIAYITDFIKQINKITDSRIRFIIKLRYVSCLPWADVDIAVFGSCRPSARHCDRKESHRADRREANRSRKLLESNFKKHCP